MKTILPISTFWIFYPLCLQARTAAHIPEKNQASLHKLYSVQHDPTWADEWEPIEYMKAARGTQMRYDAEDISHDDLFQRVSVWHNTEYKRVWNKQISEVWCGRQNNITAVQSSWITFELFHRPPWRSLCTKLFGYGNVIMGPIAFQITSLTIVYSSVYSGPDQKKN